MNPADIGARLLGLVLPVETARKLAFPGFILATVIGAFLLFGLFKLGWATFDWFNDREAVGEDRAAHNAQVNEDLREAEGEAGRTKAERDRAEDREQDELEDQVNEAEAAGDSPADTVWPGLWD